MINGDFLKCVERAANIGYDILEISVDSFIKAPELVQRKVKKFAEEKKIRLTFCARLSPEHDLASLDETTRRNGIEYLKRCLALIHKMGSCMFSGVNYAAWVSQC